MLDNKKDFLKLLVDVGDSLISASDQKPFRLQAACAKVLFFKCISEGNVADVINLLKLGVPSNAKNKDNKTALRLAVEDGYAEIADNLIFFGADTKEKIGGISFLHYAISQGFTDLVDVLVNNGSDVNELDNEGLSPLYRAAERDNFDMAEALYDNFPDEFIGTTSLIHLAVYRNSINAIRCFGDLEMNFDILDDSFETPLFKAAKAGNSAMVTALIENGADLEIRDCEGFTLLHIAAREEHYTAMKSILDAGMFVDIRGGWWNWTPLHTAASIGIVKVAEFLIQRNASITAKTSDGKTPLSIAQSACNVSMATFLSEKMAE